MTRARWWTAAALAAAAAAAASAPGRQGPRAALAAVDAEAFASLAGRGPETAGDLWERLRAMGVAAVLLKEETLADVAARGDVLHFSRPELERWKTAGLVSPSTPLRGGTLWAKDDAALSRAAAALAARGMDVSTAAAAGGKALELPPGADPARIPAGFAPDVVAAVTAAGLLPVAASTGASVRVAGQRLWTRTLDVDARPGEVRRASTGRPLRLVVFRPRPDLGLDANLDGLRASLRELRGTGRPAELPPPAAGDGEGALARRARLALLWLLGAAAPLLAARAALQASRAARPLACSLGAAASPAPQVLAGVAAAWGVAALAGLAAAGAAPEGWRDGSARAWTLWTWCAPLLAAAATLFSAGDAPGRGGWSAPVRRRDVAALLALAAAAALLLAPRAVLRASGFWESFDRLSASGVLWWWPWRWREALVGVPCLTVALASLESRDAEPAERAPGLLADPRGWITLGLLAPSGLLAAVGGGGQPLGEALAQGAAAWALGVAAGAALAALRAGADRWALSPSKRGDH